MPLPTQKSELESLLRRTEQAHKAYELALGYPDTDWESWYADFMLKSAPAQKLTEADIFGDDFPTNRPDDRPVQFVNQENQ